MHAPAQACRDLYRVHKWLRLAWLGRERRHADELNSGSFAIVQLMHNSDAGTPAVPLVFEEFWDTAWFLREGGFAVEGVDRGPIFNRHGGTSRDWDPLFRTPVLIMTIDSAYKLPDGSPFDTYAVYNSKFIPGIQHFLTSRKKRLVKQRTGVMHDFERRVDDIGSDSADFLWREAQRPDAASNPSITIEEKRNAMAVAEARWARRSRTMREHFLPPGIV